MANVYVAVTPDRLPVIVQRFRNVVLLLVLLIDRFGNFRFR